LSRKSAKVIHIVESLKRGAVENWLVRMLSHGQANGHRLDWTFYCQLSEPGSLDECVTNLGGRIIRSPVPLGRTRAFMAALRQELRQGAYEAMHCHHDLVNAIYIAASAGLPIRRRLVHVHNADECIPTPNNSKASLLREPMRRICLTADKVVGISNHTLDTFLSGRPRRFGRHFVHYYGVDPSPFKHDDVDRVAFRRSLGLPDDALILLFGGRITPEKNPVFVIDVLDQLLTMEPRAVAVFAGAGSLEAAVDARAKELGVAERLRMIGWRSDLPTVMAASDWFILPRPEHPMEGFGLAVVEAQLAGLRLLLSRGIPDDPLLASAVYRRLSLTESAASWARAAIDLLSTPAPSCESARAELEASPMAMDIALDHLLALHA
jgi:glycosyltransferase involved in cell wall biosynthesis